MPDVLVQFDDPQRSADGRLFTAQAIGDRLATGLWQAWIEFHPRVGGDPVRTPPETEQLSRSDLRFWAAGITPAHLAASLSAALSNRDLSSVGASTNALELPSRQGEQAVFHPASARTEEPVIDPIKLFELSGEYSLRQELRAMDASQLADIITAYGIMDVDVTDLARTYEDALAERIVACVQHSVATNRLQPEPERHSITK